MISVDEALALLRAHAPLLDVESIALDEAAGRTLARDVSAATAQPPFASSAMDGYAVRFADAREGARLKRVGEARAGAGPLPKLGPGEAVRIFTGGVVPEGADHILIQEEARPEDGAVIVAVAQKGPAHVRAAGLDFRLGDVLKKEGDRLSPVDVALIAAGNVARVDVRRSPVVAYFDNGDELAEPGEALSPGRVVGSNRFALDGLIAAWGGRPSYLGRAADQRVAIRSLIERARGADILVPVGGASVGDHDFVRAAFAAAGGATIFEKIAVRPGKPTWFGALSKTLALGLPGNPASAIVCATLFLRPLIAAMLGRAETDPLRLFTARLAAPLPVNGPRESFLRASLRLDASGALWVTPAADQDSALLRPLADADALVRRPAKAPAASAGEPVPCVPMRDAKGPA